MAGVLVVALLSGVAGTAQQLTYSSGQRVEPAYEGSWKNADGSVDLLFGYMNQNWKEEIDIPVGPDNSFSPGPADQGQPTHFLPRRNRFIFKVRAPADLGANEIVWTLTSRGKTVKAYGSTKPDYFLEQMTLISEKGGIGRRPGQCGGAQEPGAASTCCDVSLTTAASGIRATSPSRSCHSRAVHSYIVSDFSRTCEVRLKADTTTCSGLNSPTTSRPSTVARPPATSSRDPPD